MLVNTFHFSAKLVFSPNAMNNEMRLYSKQVFVGHIKGNEIEFPVMLIDLYLHSISSRVLVVSEFA